MKFIKRLNLSDCEKLEIIELWNNEYPENLLFNSLQDFDVYLNTLTAPSHTLLIDSNGKIIGWYFDFIRDNEKWFAIILDSKTQGKGLGTQILNTAKKYENELNGWVIDHNLCKKRNGEFYKSPLNFYLKNGFQKLSMNRLELDRISAVKIKWKK